ncbi:MAG: ABC transporter ATP-binding protein [Planctomycetota bacterium]|jgi:ABC-type multidrug transport system ATPase subunit
MNKRSQNNNSGEPVITIASVNKAFGSKLVLDNVDLAVYKSEGICICGVNGAGKSTLLRIITGLLRPAKGSVKLCGFDVNSEHEKTKAHLGLISHKSMLYPDLTIPENLHFFARLYGVKDARNRIKKLIADIELSPYWYDKASVLSRGMLQRLAIARAIVHNPTVLLADEPFTGLDTQASQHLLDVLGKFQADGGTLVMTTHNTRLAIQCCERVVVLDKGRFIFDAKTNQIDKTAFIEDYCAYARSQN